MITVYGVEGKANYNEMEKKVESLKQLAAPFYDIGEAKYSFNEIDKAMDTVKALNFPILMNQESAHHFNEIAKLCIFLLPFCLTWLPTIYIYTRIIQVHQTHFNVR